MSITAPPYEDPGQHATEAVLGYTTSLQYGEEGATPGTFEYTDIGEVTDLTVWDASRDSVEVTNHRSPGWSVETIPALIDWGSASFELNAVPAHLADPTHPQGSLLASFREAGNNPWRVVFPDGTSVDFLASLVSFSLTAPVKDVMKASCELKLSGDPTFTPTPLIAPISGQSARGAQDQRQGGGGRGPRQGGGETQEATT